VEAEFDCSYIYIYIYIYIHVSIPGSLTLNYIFSDHFAW
jgi:hypothetical protein